MQSSWVLRLGLAASELTKQFGWVWALVLWHPPGMEHTCAGVISLLLREVCVYVCVSACASPGTVLGEDETRT